MQSFGLVVILCGHIKYFSAKHSLLPMFPWKCDLFDLEFAKYSIHKFSCRRPFQIESQKWCCKYNNVICGAAQTSPGLAPSYINGWKTASLAWRVYTKETIMNWWLVIFAVHMYRVIWCWFVSIVSMWLQSSIVNYLIWNFGPWWLSTLRIK